MVLVDYALKTYVNLNSYFLGKYYNPYILTHYTVSQKCEHLSSFQIFVTWKMILPTNRTTKSRKWKNPEFFFSQKIRPLTINWAMIFYSSFSSLLKRSRSLISFCFLYDSSIPSTTMVLYSMWPHLDKTLKRSLLVSLSLHSLVDSCCLPQVPTIDTII